MEAESSPKIDKLYTNGQTIERKTKKKELDTNGSLEGSDLNMPEIGNDDDEKDFHICDVPSWVIPQELSCPRLQSVITRLIRIF